MWNFHVITILRLGGDPVTDIHKYIHTDKHTILYYKIVGYSGHFVKYPNKNHRRSAYLLQTTYEVVVYPRAQQSPGVQRAGHVGPARGQHAELTGHVGMFSIDVIHDRRNLEN
jgi:hypothetical protein